jgi:type II secretory pathway component GspD/PulD (secretin)
MEFRNQDIGDVLQVLAQIGSVSIVSDETVRGNVSYFFTEGDFSVAFDAFLKAYRLYVRKEGSVWYVSRVRVDWDPVGETASLDVEDVDIQLVLTVLSRSIGTTILYDTLPREVITVHAQSLSPYRVAELIIKKYPGYSVISEDDHIYIRRAQSSDSRGTSSPGYPKVESISRSASGLYSVDKDAVRFIDLLEELFKKEGKEFSLLLRADAQLERVRWRDKSFEQLLRLVLEQANADFTLYQGVYYLFEIQRKDTLKKLKETVILPLRFLSVQELMSLVPADLASGGFFKIDRSTNSLVVTGSPEEIGPVLEFFRSIDKPIENKEYRLYCPVWIRAKDMMALLPSWLSSQGPVMLPDGSGFLVALTVEQRVLADAFMATVDQKLASYPVRLRYITSEELLKALPPTGSKDDIVESGSPSLIFYTGAPGKYERFMREIELVDKPKPQIRYDLLVLQLQRADSFSWSKSLEVEPATTGGQGYTVAGALESLLSLNFDVVAEFGYRFAASLNLELEDSYSRVFADTTLTALSGKEVKFQNTETYRYRDTMTTTDGTVSVTRELTSGIILSINGWVSGDGMVTMTVSTAVSKRNSDSSTDTSVNPPGTTERVISSWLRTQAGEPVVLSGLLQREREIINSKVPVLGDIPLLGFLFQNSSIKEQETELVIYIVPRILPPGGSAWVGDTAGFPDVEAVSLEMERIYLECVSGRIVE